MPSKLTSIASKNFLQLTKFTDYITVKHKQRTAEVFLKH